MSDMKIFIKQRLHIKNALVKILNTFWHHNPCVFPIVQIIFLHIFLERLLQRLNNTNQRTILLDLPLQSFYQGQGIFHSTAQMKAACIPQHCIVEENEKPNSILMYSSYVFH